MKLNGNLVLNTDATGELQNVYVERLAAAPAFLSNQKGRIYFNTVTSTYYFNDGAAWSPFATGGNAAALQSEVDAIEAALGSSINANGTYNSAGFSTNPVIGGSTTVTEAIQALATKAAATDTLAELGDVALGSLANGQYLKYNADTSMWNNSTLVLANVTDVTASAASVNLLTGAALGTGAYAAGPLSATQLSYLGGATPVTSSIQAQLDNKQALDATLTGLAGLAGTGIIVETGVDTFTHRSLVQPAAGVTISNADGVAGNPTFALANDLAGLEGLATTGYAVRTGDGTWTTRSISSLSSRIVVTEGSGVVSNTDLDLATLADAGTGTFLKFTRDAYGRVSGTTAVVLSDITGLADGTYVNVTGDTMTGNLVFSGGVTVSGVPNPTLDTQVANKAYVDAVAAGLSWKQAVKAASTGNVALAIGSSATLDGVALVAGDRVLLKDQTAGAENGIYVYDGSALARSTDMDAAAEFSGATVFVTEGTVNKDSGWTQTAEVATLGTTAVAWAQFSGSSTYTWGTGLSSSGNTISVNLGAGIAELPSDEVGLDLYTPSTNALILTTDGSTRAPLPGTNAQLALLLASGGGLTQDATGLYVPANGITNGMILNDVNGLNADSGTGSLALGQTLTVTGASAQGIVTSASGQTINVTASDASYSQMGVASFDTLNFAVTTGAVSIKAAGVDNIQLANSTITFAGAVGTPQAVALGATVTLGDGGSHSTSGSLIETTAVATNRVNIAVRQATSSLLGVASFAAADFSVTAGAVSLVAKGLDALTDVAVSAPAAGQTLVYNGTNFVNRPTYFLYTSTGASTTHTVNHSLGQKYCNVTVVDGSDEVVIPQSITFTGTGTLVVTFTSAIDCKVIVMGVNQGA